MVANILWFSLSLFSSLQRTGNIVSMLLFCCYCCLCCASIFICDRNCCCSKQWFLKTLVGGMKWSYLSLATTKDSYLLFCCFRHCGCYVLTALLTRDGPSLIKIWALVACWGGKNTCSTRTNIGPVTPWQLWAVVFVLVEVMTCLLLFNHFLASVKYQINNQ